MGTIITIGGGQEPFSRTPHISKKIIELSQKQNPNVLFIGTATRDSKDYIDNFTEFFTLLGANVDCLELVSSNPTREAVKESIMNHDIIYVGGGDTRFMIKHWKQFNLKEVLIEAYHKGIILCGVSAGSICWYQWGNSDSESFGEANEWNFIQTPGLGFINLAHCPHYDDSGRDSFDGMMNGEESIDGIALENGTALLVQDGKGQIIKDDDNKKGYYFKQTEKGILKLEIEDDTIIEILVNI